MSDFGGFSEFRVGSVLKRTWAIIWRKPVFFFGVAFLLALVVYTLMNFLASIALYLASMSISSYSKYVSAGMYATTNWNSVDGFVFFVFVGVLFQGVLSHYVFMLLLTERASVLKSLKRAARRFFSVICGLLLMYIALRVIVNVFFFMMFMFLGNAMGSLGLLRIVIISNITYWIFYSVLNAKWYLFSQACVIERLGGPAGLSRSSALTEGYRLKIFSLFALIYIFIVITAIITDFIFARRAFGILFFILIVIIPFAYSLVMPSVVYYSLRVVKEGLTPDSLEDCQAVSEKA